ncbi:BTAD domain-containing putative transcriptional regulator [Amycolatopsis sp. 195334CR]|uniref:AfsR/SARP family transcriptional regulator n=1 Tax=Amycolatopsis sp. 195334CR TaxID=2814588 RepID=UPI001A8F9B2D|nr:BTAD domain-containing putative transcriptional regulator [Amycolatopsis sp. 195334CR]MBN6041055.1 winged helix-turn-helix domain-containing protein [Amycolatopsis sp. 195334CR]
MEFRVLGPVAVRRGERTEVLTGSLRRTLLGVLLARRGRPVPVDVLTDALWGERPDPRAPKKLQLHVHRLRAILDVPERLSFGTAGYRLEVRPGELDADRFEALAEAGIATARREPQRAVESLRAALALWQGNAFAEAEVPLLADWARRLAELRLTAIESLYQAELECGLHEAVIGELTGLARAHPLRERLHELLITALHRAGRQDEALEAYRRAHGVLAAELGLAPGPALRGLRHRVLSEPAPVASAVPAQLPADAGAITGRHAELAELDAAAPLSVVTGPAGAGKTALVVHWARQRRDRFPDGQLYADLRGYGEPAEPADVLAGFLRALGVTAIPAELEERAAAFRTLADRRRMLVLLDNAGSAEQVRPLLPAGSTCCTLVTSRDPLAGLVVRYGAHRIRLGRLPAPDAAGLLRELLGGDTEADTLAELAELCAGVPLALRVVAELVRHETPDRAEVIRRTLAAVTAPPRSVRPA